MSAKHTQGPLVLGQYGAIRGGPMVRFINGSAQEQLAMTTGTSWMEPSEHLANARRMVACWNACEGISTERLEDLGRPLMQHLIGCDERAARQVKEAADLTSQRGTLRAALRCAIKKAPELITVPVIRSAIENAEGGK